MLAIKKRGLILTTRLKIALNTKGVVKKPINKRSADVIRKDEILIGLRKRY